jgi:hypothetical protein
VLDERRQGRASGMAAAGSYEIERLYGIPAGSLIRFLIVVRGGRDHTFGRFIGRVPIF